MVTAAAVTGEDGSRLTLADAAKGREKAWMSPTFGKEIPVNKKNSGTVNLGDLVCPYFLAKKENTKYAKYSLLASWVIHGFNFRSQDCVVVSSGRTRVILIGGREFRSTGRWLREMKISE